MAYSYKYTPKGNNGDTIINWLRNQKNKAESLNLLILRAQREYGDQDIVDLTTQAFLDNRIQASPNVSANPQPSTQQVESTPNPQPQNQKQNPSQNSEPKDSQVEKPETKETSQATPKKPNLGLLSR